MKSNLKRIIMKYTLLICGSMSIMCTAIISPALPIMKQFFHDYKNAEILVKLAATSPNIFIAISAPIFGIMANKFNKKKTLIFSLAIYTLSGSFVSYLDNLYYIIITRCLLGISLASLLTIGMELIAVNFTGQERNGALAAQTTVMSIGSVVFTMLSGIICDINWRFAFLLYGTGAILLPFVLFFVNSENEKNQKVLKNSKLDESQRLESSNSSFGRIFGNKLPIIICFIGFVNMVCFYMIPIQIPFVLKGLDPLLSSKKISFIITIEVIVSALFATKYKRLKKNRTFESMCAISIAVMAISYAGLSYCKTYNDILFYVALYGLGMALMMPNNIVWIVNSSSARNRAFWIGMLTTGTYLGKFASPLVVTPLIAIFGPFKSYRIVSFVMLFLGLLVIFFGGDLKSKRRRRFALNNVS